MSNVVQLAVNAVRQRHGIDPWPPGYAEAVDARINAAIAAVDSSSKPAILAAALLLKSIVREAERGFAEERRGRGATFQR